MEEVGTSTHVNVEDVATTTEVSQPTNHREKIVADVAVMTVPPVAPQKPDAGASSSSYADDADARTGPKDPAALWLSWNVLGSEEGHFIR